jgi:hypothetical protein
MRNCFQASSCWAQRVPHLFLFDDDDVMKESRKGLIFDRDAFKRVECQPQPSCNSCLIAENKEKSAVLDNFSSIIFSFPILSP